MVIRQLWYYDNKLTRQEVRVLVVDEVGEITTVIQDHVQRLVAREGRESLFDTPVVLLFGLALPGEDRDTSDSDAGDTNMLAMNLIYRNSPLTLLPHDPE